MKKIGYYILPVLWLVFACGQENQTESEQEAEVKVEAEKNAEEKPAFDLDPEVLATGETTYKAYCLACHMENGMGVPGMNPPLAKTKYVNGEKERLIGIVLNGLTEPLEVLGETYTNIMAPHNHLSDEEIAGVLTYVRNNFGNQSGPVTAEEVATVRAKQ